MIQVYTGEGKGKTTAAVGLCARAAGRGMRVYFTQFMKGNDTGELYALRALPQVTVLRSDKNYGFYSSLSESDKEQLTAVHNGILDTLLEAVEGGTCDVAVLDEITYPLRWGLVDGRKLERLLEKGRGSDGVELVLTGRGAGVLLTEAADYITEMRCVRHPHEKGVMARRGIEF